MRRLLTAVALFTLIASCWLTVMTFVLHHPPQQAVIFALFIVQSALTLAALGALVPGAAVLTAGWIRPVILAGAVGILYSGWTTVAEQASRSGFDPAHPRAPHFEGYALIVGLALAVQGILTLAAFLLPPSSSSVVEKATLNEKRQTPNAKTA
jgi:hypothetical protein